MKCKCGYENEPDAVFCGNCGTKLKKKKSGGVRWWLVLLLMVLCLGLGFLAGKFLPLDSDNDRASHRQEEREEEDKSDSEDEARNESSEPSGDAEPEAPSVPAGPDGWVREENSIRYYAEGKYMTGVVECKEGTIGERSFPAGWYFFDETGAMDTGWQKVEGNDYFFTEEGPAPEPGWREDDKGWYYLNEKGMLLRSQDIPNGMDIYTVDEDGYLTKIRYGKIACTEKTAGEADGGFKYLAPDQVLEKCTGLTLHNTSGTSFIADITKDLEIWCFDGRQWELLSCPLSQEENRITIQFEQPVTLAGIRVCKKEVVVDLPLEPAIYDVTVNVK